MGTTCKEVHGASISHSKNYLCKKLSPCLFFFFLTSCLTTHCCNLSKRGQAHLSAYSCNLCFIHAGFCHNISKWSPSKVLHHHKQFVSHQVAKIIMNTQKILIFLTSLWVQGIQMSGTLITNIGSWKLWEPGRKLASCYATAQKINWGSLWFS